MRGLFIVGTDTGVGKTCVGTALLRLARRRGIRLVPFKPVETGAQPTPADALQLHSAAGLPDLADLVCLYPLPLPAAPQAAATAAGVSISTEAILDRARSLAAVGDGLLVEGAGGLLVPYRPDLTGADLAALLGFPVLLVARTALGTINHVALTVNELRRRAIPLAGLILVQTQAVRDPHEDSNLPLIDQLTGVTALATLPHIPAASPDALALALEAAMAPEDLTRLLFLASGRPSPQPSAPSRRVRLASD